MTIATELAKRIRAVTFDGLPKAAVEWAKMGILDTVGVTLAGSLEPAHGSRQPFPPAPARPWCSAERSACR
jgi:2-methylcitrate dehydratase PrpD